jgi:hypothetical protein
VFGKVVRTQMNAIEKKKMQTVTIGDFARSFGTTPDDFSSQCLRLIDGTDFSYRRCEQQERDGIILEVLRKLKSDHQVIAAPERKGIWEKGWAENLAAFQDSGFDPQALMPKFLRENQPIRYAGDYIMPRNPRFEYDFMTVFRTWLFQKYLADKRTVYEFGCGTGLNLVLLADLFPESVLYGLDFVPSAVGLVNAIGENGPGNIHGHLFDMIHPDGTFDLEPGSAVLTFGALEQLAGRFTDFIEFLLAKKPALVMHVEPTVELYDENLLFDFLAVEFHRKRGYTENLLPHLQALERRGSLRILKTKRLFFGSLFMEGYTYMVWQPVQK